ncbi:MAG: 16S rRNA (cytidine(1402)-2'-O)-methyltransferase [Dehalococcoidia bacterium]|tara:strand:- start:1227 stop:2054 length:828 start_codon:yes stop_codon:yes gene_type:complete
MNPLYIVPTPIGNLEDITIRSLNILKNSNLILCEDTRRTSILLNHYSIKKKLVSFNKDNENKKTDKILELLETNIISLVSDAGTPTVSDPGSKLVRKLIEEGIEVIPLPGASSITTAFSASGLDGDFIFAGFLPKNENDLKKNLLKLNEIKKNIIIFESPKRITKFLEISRKIFTDSNLIIFKELTKINEKIILVKPDDTLPDIKFNKGEFVIIIENKESKQINNIYNDEIIVNKLKELLDLKFTGKDSIRITSNYLGVNQKKIYNMYLNNFNEK